MTHGKFGHAGLSEKTAERGVFLDLNVGSRNPPFRGTFWRKGVPESMKRSRKSDKRGVSMKRSRKGGCFHWGIIVNCEIDIHWTMLFEHNPMLHD